MKKDDTIFGIMTDRCLLSVLLLLRLSRIPVGTFDFIQTRRSLSDPIAYAIFGEALLCQKTHFWSVKKIKPDKSVITELKRFCYQEGIGPNNMFFIEDSKPMRLLIRKLGFRSKENMKYVNL